MEVKCKNCSNFEGKDKVLGDYTCYATNRSCAPNDSCELFKPSNKRD
ncbi:hypothetical protein LCGC14_2017340 [marine sediment metagenome]|uniref:Uncharacterized protein n=1 Tax=marine sediment metagenome TaxID=412755 RepID=A0A0F9EYQ6_9ZZZZ